MIGQHLLADLYDVASDRLVDAGLLADCLDEAARRGGMKPIGPPVLHRFEGVASRATSSSRSLTSRSTLTPSTDISLSISSPAEVPIRRPRFRFSSPPSSPAATNYHGAPRRGDPAPRLRNPVTGRVPNQPPEPA